MNILMSSRKEAKLGAGVQWIDILPGQYAEGTYPAFPKTEGNRVTIYVAECAGALCEALYAVDYIDNDAALVIGDYPVGRNVLQELTDRAAACLLYGAAETDRDGEAVVQLRSGEGVTAAFARGADFVRMAKTVILKGKKAGEQFTVADAVNELILSGGIVYSI